MTIAFFEVKEEWEKEAIRKAFPKKRIQTFETTLEDTDLNKYKDISILSVFVYSKCSKKVLSQLPKLKMISVRGTGYDQVDLQYCKKHNITVTNVPSYGESTVAEFTLALLLAITRKVPESIARVRSGLFDFTGLRGMDLHGKTVGLIGFGRIGQKFAKMCKGLEMNVLVYDVNRKFATEKAKEVGVEVATLTKIYKEADIISLHMPLTEKTKHFVRRETLNKMKEGVILLNTAREGTLSNQKTSCKPLELEG